MRLQPARLGGILLAVVTTLLASVPMAVAADRVALVIGNGAYRSANALPNPPNDAADIAAALRRIGFDVVEGRDLDKRGDGRQDREFGRKLDARRSGPVLLCRPRPAGRRQELSGAGRRQARARRPTSASTRSTSPRCWRRWRPRSGSTSSSSTPAATTRWRARSPAALGTRSASRRPGARRHPERDRHHDRLCDAARQRRARRRRAATARSPTALLKHIATPGLEIGSLMKRVRADVIAATQREAGAVGSFLAGRRRGAGAGRNGARRRAHPPVAAPALQHLAARPDPGREPRPARPRSASESCASFNGALGLERYCASSILAPQFGNSYGVQNLFEGSGSTAWVEGRPGHGVGEWIVIEFDGPRLITGIEIRNGYQKNSDIYYKNSRVRRLRVVFSQGESRTFTLQDKFGAQTISLDRPIKAYWAQFIIDEVYAGQQIYRYRPVETAGRVGSRSVSRPHSGLPQRARDVVANSLERLRRRPNLLDRCVDGAPHAFQPLQCRLPGLPLGQRESRWRERREPPRRGDGAIEKFFRHRRARGPDRVRPHRPVHRSRRRKSRPRGAAAPWRNA